MNFWDVSCRGFLPSIDPMPFLTNYSLDFISDAMLLENLATMMPNFVADRCFREEIVAQLRSKDLEQLIKQQDVSGSERLMLIFSYFASAFVYATHENPAKRVPKEIAIPLNMLANRLSRKPILSYASYCLTNWKRKSLQLPPELGNIELLQNFRADEAKRDEDWFILVHVDIEYQASAAIRAIFSSKPDDVQFILESMRSSLVRMNATLNRMPEQCSPDVYYLNVRPYIFGFDNVVYEGCFNNEPQTFRGETGAQSSIIPTFQTVLGVKHSDSMLTKHLEEMRGYMPAPHRRHIANLELTVGSKFRDAAKAASLNDLYNECLEEFIKFRKKHLEYAVQYIQNRTNNPTGTGGTPFIPWLSLLIKETEEFYL